MNEGMKTLILLLIGIFALVPQAFSLVVQFSKEWEEVSRQYSIFPAKYRRAGYVIGLLCTVMMLFWIAYILGHHPNVCPEYEQISEPIYHLK